LNNFKWRRVIIRQMDGKLVDVHLDQLGEDERCYLTAHWGDGVGLPPECLLRGTPQLRNFTALCFMWKASGLCHKPLYFEQVQLERYGHSMGPLMDPVVSGAHFFANIATLPYHMTNHPPCECVYPLGYFRPGDCAPYMIPPVPLSAKATIVQAGAVVGAAAIIP
jgi:hypothetical protein